MMSCMSHVTQAMNDWLLWRDGMGLWRVLHCLGGYWAIFPVEKRNLQFPPPSPYPFKINQIYLHYNSLYVYLRRRFVTRNILLLHFTRNFQAILSIVRQFQHFARQASQERKRLKHWTQWLKQYEQLFTAKPSVTLRLGMIEMFLLGKSIQCLETRGGYDVEILVTVLFY